MPTDLSAAAVMAQEADAELQRRDMKRCRRLHETGGKQA